MGAGPASVWGANTQPKPATWAGLAYEFTWDGVRAITYLQYGGLWVYSRNDRNVTATYPELGRTAERL